MVEDGELHFHDINMMDIINQYGTPLKITYLPKISSQIQRAKRMFNVAMAKVDYKGTYTIAIAPRVLTSSSFLRKPLRMISISRLRLHSTSILLKHLRLKAL